MMKKAVLMLVFLCSCLMVLPQEMAEIEEEEKREVGKHELAVDVASYIAGSPTLGLMYRRNNEKRSFRLGWQFGGGLEFRDQGQGDGMNGVTTTSMATQVRIGGQRNHLFGTLGVYYGVDGVLGYAYAENQSESEFVADETTQQNTANRLQHSPSVGAIPFVGANYRINHRLGVGLEASLRLLYSYQRASVRTNRTIIENQTGDVISEDAIETSEVSHNLRMDIGSGSDTRLAIWFSVFF